MEVEVFLKTTYRDWMEGKVPYTKVKEMVEREHLEKKELVDFIKQYIHPRYYNNLPTELRKEIEK